MRRLFSYVVEHDEGRSPNPFGRYCTLAHCKFNRKGRRRNIVEIAKEGDWIVGTGGASVRSAGHGRIVYAMKVTQKLPLEDYYANTRFKGRIDNRAEDSPCRDRFVLISTDFYYFGRNARKIPPEFASHPLEKKGPGFRYRNFDNEFISAFEAWLRSTGNGGRRGDPCCGPPHAAITALRRSCRSSQPIKKRACSSGK